MVCRQLGRGWIISRGLGLLADINGRNSAFDVPLKTVAGIFKLSLELLGYKLAVDSWRW